MKEIERIKLDETDLDYLQRLSFEVDARNRVVITLLENHALDGNDAVLNSPAFKTYSKQLSELTAELELAKSSVGAKYVPEKYKNSTTAVWEVDFSTGEMAIKE